MARTRRPCRSNALAALILFAPLLSAAAAVAASAADTTIPQAKGIPRLVYVARTAAGGRLLVREKDGRTHPLPPDSLFHDVERPVASWDAKRIVFAARAAADSAWRIWTVGADGRGLAQVTRTDRVLDLAPLGAQAAARFARYDDFDPAWLPDGRIVFASTRFPQVSQQYAMPVPNLFTVRADGTALERITTDRNAAEKPAVDPVTGRLLYARWFFNPYQASDSTASGLTLDPALALPHEPLRDWQAVTIYPDGDRIQLAAGDPRDHDSSGCYAPCPLPGGGVVGLRAHAPYGPPAQFADELVLYPDGVGPGRVLNIGRSLRARGGRADETVFGYDPGAFRLSRNRLGIQSPNVLPDGRIEFALNGGVLSDLGLYAISPRDSRLTRIVDEPNVDETDPFPLVPRKVPPILQAQGGIDDPAELLPATELSQVQRMDNTFRFDCLNVFASGPVDSPTPSAPALARNVRIRFFATLARPNAATGDTVVLAREAKVTPAGGVHESDMPGDVPMFEELVDSLGHVLMSAHGPAFVPGSNFARVEAGTKCIGCHAGHSTLTVPKNYSDARWFNASPSARVTASSVRAGAAAPAALVDRVAKGPVERVGWVADGPGPQSARLEWATPIEAREFVLYAPWTDSRAGTDVQVRACTLVLMLHGKEVGRAESGRVRPEGTRVEIAPLVLDAVEIRPTATGTVTGRPAVALAEIETIARLPETP